MEIIIQGRQAVLKKGTSFDFIAENRLFTDSDSYTLSMVFPLAGCAQNLQIFGHLERKDVSKERVVYDCEIRHLSMVRVGVFSISWSWRVLLLTRSTLPLPPEDNLQVMPFIV